MCFFALIQIWYRHHQFFRRYGLQDRKTNVLNCCLLFIVLFYVYPLKFLASYLLGASTTIDLADARSLMEVYGIGVAAVALIFLLLYRHALNLRALLALNPTELRETTWDAAGQIGIALIAGISMLLAATLPARWIGLSGWSYLLIGVLFAALGYGRSRAK